MTDEKIIQMINILQEQLKTLSDTITVHAFLLNELADLLDKPKNDS